MIKSMTGFGRGSAGKNNKKVNAEIRAVNSRFLELKIRGITLNPQLEGLVRERISDTLQRGNIHLKLEFPATQDPSAMKFNRDRYEKLQSVVQEIHVEYGQRLDIGDIISANDLIAVPEPSDLNKKVLLDAVSNALNQVNQMREKEGDKLKIDLESRINRINEKISIIEEEAIKFSDEKTQALRKKVSDLLSDGDLDENRLIQEVAYLVERADISEELVRSRSHFEQFNAFLNTTDEPVGKRLNFLLQEIGRETNTIGSKSPMTQVTNLIIDVKGELEKIREQVQNVL